MNPRDPISPKDLELARRLGEALEDPRALSSFRREAELERAYQALREERLKDQPNAEASSRMWQEIETQTRPAATDAPARIHVMPSLMRWAAVAAILVTALLAYYLIPGTAEEMLLARAGDEVEQVSLADGSSILLRPHSAAYERPSGSSDYVVRLEGEAYFDVVTKPDRSFGVETAHGAVRVLGTAFSVRTWGGRTEVFLERGALSVEHARSLESAVLSPGMAALLEERGITVSDDGDAAEYRDWIRGELTFVERPARRVVAELAHHFDLSIDLQEPLANETITGSLTLDSAEAALSELALVLGAEISGSREAGFVVRAR